VPREPIRWMRATRPRAMPSQPPVGRRAHVGAHALHVLAAMETIGLEVRAVAGVRPVRVAAQLDAVVEARGALDGQEGRRGRLDDQLLAAGGRHPRFDGGTPRGFRIGLRQQRRQRRSGAAVAVEADDPGDVAVLLVAPDRRRVQGLPQHQGRRDLVLARVPPGRAVAPVPQGPAFGPQRDLEVVGRAAHDRVDALESAAEPLDAGFARVARPLADRLTADAGEEGVDDRGGDHGGGAFFIAGRFSQIGVDDATAPPRHSGRTRRPLSRSYSRGIAVSGSPKAS